MNDHAKTLQQLKSSAQGAATVRAFACLEADSQIRNPDTLARHFIDAQPVGGNTLTAFKAQLQSVLPGAYHFQNARTLHIDARIKQAINEGYKQIVLLGAGYDSRAYRLVEPEQGVRFIEVDLPLLQADKKQQLVKLLGRLPSHVSFCPLDFNHQSLDELLARSDFDRSLPSYFNWEGVSYYLNADGVDATLQWISTHAAPTSRLLFDYMPRSMIDGRVDYYGGKESRDYMAAMGEAVIFGIADGSINAFLNRRGFDVCEDMSPELLAEKYLRKSDGRIDGRVAGYIRIVEAEVL